MIGIFGHGAVPFVSFIIKEHFAPIVIQVTPFALF